MWLQEKAVARFNAFSDKYRRFESRKRDSGSSCLSQQSGSYASFTLHSDEREKGAPAGLIFTS